MNIRYKSIESERTEDAPFIGALVCAIDCKFGCKGCFNDWIKESEIPYYVKTAEEIVEIIKQNPLNKGIILAGLEWSLQPQELIELASVASKNGLEVMIYTGCTLDEFETIIGKSCAERIGYGKELSSYVSTKDDEQIYAFIGSMVLDTMITGEYYIKCGRYDETKRSPDRKHFGVRLASENQTIYKFTKGNDENYGKRLDKKNYNKKRTTRRKGKANNKNSETSN